MDFDDIEVDATYGHADVHPETAAALESFEMRKRARAVAVPTKDAEIRAALRALGEPVTLFGEYTEDRSDRLRAAMARAGVQGAGDPAEETDTESDSGSADSEEEEFYTEGTPELLALRSDIAEFSMRRAAARLAAERVKHETPLSRTLAVRKSVFAALESYAVYGSIVGDTRPCGVLKFSPDARYLLTSGWSGRLKLWDVRGSGGIKSEASDGQADAAGDVRMGDESQPETTIDNGFSETPIWDIPAHSDRVGGVAWAPATTGTPSPLSFASCGADGAVNLYDIRGSVLRSIAAHKHRACRVAFHPSGRVLGSTSLDTSWRLFDAETGTELLLQEGHSHGTYALSFQDDGALACSGGMDAVARLWDMRSGKSVMVLDGHQREVLAVDFAPDGHTVATGSNDDTVQLWDLRAMRSVYTIRSHTSTVSDVKFFRPSDDCALLRANTTETDEIRRETLPGVFLLTASYDGAVKFWSSGDYQYITSFKSENKIMSVDVAGDARYIAAAEYNRTFKLYSADGA